MNHWEQMSGYHSVKNAASIEVYVCPSCEKSSVVLDLSASEPCCHGQLNEVVGTFCITPTELASVLADIHDVPRSGTEICCALLSDLSSTTAIAECLGRDTETVRDHLNRLVDAGLLDRTTLPREGGGTVAVYALTDDGCPPTLAEFCVWAARAGGEAPIEIDSDQ